LAGTIGDLLYRKLSERNGRDRTVSLIVRANPSNSESHNGLWEIIRQNHRHTALTFRALKEAG